MCKLNYPSMLKPRASVTINPTWQGATFNIYLEMYIIIQICPNGNTKQDQVTQYYSPAPETLRYTTSDLNTDPFCPPQHTRSERRESKRRAMLNREKLEICEG